MCRLFAGAALHLQQQAEIHAVMFGHSLCCCWNDIGGSRLSHGWSTCGFSPHPGACLGRGPHMLCHSKSSTTSGLSFSGASPNFCAPRHVFEHAPSRLLAQCRILDRQLAFLPGSERKLGRWLRNSFHAKHIVLHSPSLEPSVLDCNCFAD